MDAEQEHRRAPGRPRSRQVGEAVTTATLKLLQSTSYKNITMERIAKEAGVGKPSLYRRWPGVPFIVMETLQLHAEREIRIPDTGRLKTDVFRYMQQTCQALAGRTGEFVRCLMAEAQWNSEFAAVFRETFIASRRRHLIGILERGMRRGELPADSNCELLADLLYGPMWYRLLNGHAPLDEPFVHGLVDQLFHDSEN
ncbi:TetR/AcrR family transcriptional regulator [Paenibacillus humicola]|uniref:TetR/AcrR family transcriptional regulator n=1 Tax=Paenibacillus humicola TaxID=3110540 RepID=UPI00237BE3B4|nr:TetR/AcrR family transcriptional regulator [Paenibacillus humicola]